MLTPHTVTYARRQQSHTKVSFLSGTRIDSTQVTVSGNIIVTGKLETILANTAVVSGNFFFQYF